MSSKFLKKHSENKFLFKISLETLWKTVFYSFHPGKVKTCATDKKLTVSTYYMIRYR